MPGFYATANTTSPASSVGVVEKARVIDGRAGAARRCVDRAAVSRSAHERVFARAAVFFELPDGGPIPAASELGTTIGEALLAPHRSY